MDCSACMSGHGNTRHAIPRSCGYAWLLAILMPLSVLKGAGESNEANRPPGPPPRLAASRTRGRAPHPEPGGREVH